MEKLVLLIAMFLSLLNPQPTTTTTDIYVHPISNPVRIAIPSIEVDADITSVGIKEDKSMQVPAYNLAGWYNLGPVPGGNGPSVIVGHVSSKGRKGVFYDLKKLKPGSEVYVYSDTGDYATFIVDYSEVILKTELPTERIWNDTYQPLLRLITCGGEFDKQSGHYLSNVIVWAHLTK